MLFKVEFKQQLSLLSLTLEAKTISKYTFNGIDFAKLIMSLVIHWLEKQMWQMP